MHGTRNGLQLTCGLLIFNVSAMFEGEKKNLQDCFLARCFSVNECRVIF